MAAGLKLEPARVALEDAGEGVLLTRGGHRVLLAEVVAREHQGPPGMLLLGVAEQVGRVADLGLHFLLAVTEVVVGDDGNDHAACVAGAHLEGLPCVVQLVGVGPAHAVPQLPLGRLAGVRQPEVGLLHPRQVRGEDHRAGVAGPGLRLQRCVILRQVRVATVAEDALDEVEVGHEPAGHDEAGLHALLTHVARHRRGDEGTQLERDEAGRRVRLVGGVRQHEVDLRWLERELEEPREHRLGHTDLVIGDRQAALGDVEDACGGAAIVGRVVQDAVREPVAAQQR